VYGLLLACCLAGYPCAAQTDAKALIVDQSGTGDFTSIQDAINSLPDEAAAQRIIFIRNGVYREKIFIEKDFVTLLGEDKHNVLLTISLARDVWRCENKDDWGVATINLKGSDIVLENLSVTNSFGFDHLTKPGIHIDCRLDSINPFKTVGATGHQMALRSFNTTRLIARNCIFRAYGGDTVSPWNVDSGMFYFKDCLMEGGVDFYCPRGWAYAENCEFVAHGNVAAIWHDGSKVKDSKTVLNNCVFRGDDGFKLGRYHRDAQFFILNSSFANNMADAPIYLNPSSPQNLIQWGERVYYYNSHRTGGDYTWHKDNLDKASAQNINAEWTFAGKWKPNTQPTYIDPALKAGSKNNKPTGSSFNGARPIDSVAENMLVYQRAIGGWPKAISEVVVNYTKPLTASEKKMIRADSLRSDATIDNRATSKEIRYLVTAYKQTNNKEYLAAAEKGIAYLLKAQNLAGGWPQYYPDSTSYRAQITYNDDAMINVLNILQDIVESKNGFEVVSPSLVSGCSDAVSRGIECILNTQIKVDGKLTAWCAQHDRRTLQPVMARKFELVSLSGMESVNITRFLMRVKTPSQRSIDAVKASIAWLEQVRIDGFAYKDIVAPQESNGRDRVLVASPGNSIWARFYEIGTNRPFFSGRDSQKKYNVAEIEHERRTGYAWYGTWPENLLKRDYPEWLKRINKPS
jgi:PelA/Pel-15E family pectate lyase